MAHSTLLNRLSLFCLVISLDLWFIILPLDTDAQEPEQAGDVQIQAVVGSGFSYQGSLVKNGVPVNGSCNFQFSLWDAASGGNQLGVTQTVNGVTVSQGSFAVTLNGSNQFGSAPFTGSARYLSIAVLCPGDSSFIALSPLVALNPVPYALALPGLWTQQNNASPNIIGGYSGNTVSPTGEGITISGGGAVNLINSASGHYSVIGGGRKNTANGLESTVAGGADNSAGGSAATVGGGLSNSAGGSDATVSGGIGNTANGNRAAVGGGNNNHATGANAVISGGQDNQVNNSFATVGGGQDNNAGGSNAVIAGGINNSASGYAATVAGGDTNSAQGFYSFAAGRRATAGHAGAFVWGDGTDAGVASTGDNQFIVRASGGVTMYTNSTLSAGAALHAGSGSWSNLSDRRVKENLAPVDGRQVLALLAEIPVTTWNYKSQAPAIRHMGPMAQDLYAQFNLGESETQISTVDADGVALAGLQGLYQITQEQAAQIEALQAENASLAARLAALETYIAQMQPGDRP